MIGASDVAVIISVAAATSDMPGARTRSVPSRVTRARERMTRSPGSRTPNSGEHGDEVLQDRRVDGAVGPHVIGEEPGEGPLELLG